ncbi:MAG: type III ribulose-bisphosphate carboxylase [Candidatus Bathyarchaeota archaeon]|nr:type III ribulose-bisphosphate carboxylase [Candidatus Bathyarchaeota archaeon]
MDFVDFSYSPKEDDLICDFYVEPRGIDIKVAAGGVAAESSIGTWTELTTVKTYVEKLRATVFEINGNNVRIAYPVELFELANMPNILSSIAGNVFGLGALRKLRLNDVYFPSKIADNFKGPKYGIDGVRKLLEVKDRALVGTIIKPKLGLKTEDHAEVAFNAWVGGCDIVKDDENLSSQQFNPFEDRVIKTLECRDKAEQETGEKKVYMVNVTSETSHMIERAQFVEEHGGRYMMVDILTCGFAALQTLRNQNFDLVIHAHRAGHAAFTKDSEHGVAMRVIAKVSRIIGVDQLHVGTAVGKMSETREEVLENCDALKAEIDGLKPVLPVASGGLHPSLVPALIEIFGKDFVIQAGGGIHGHRDGTVAGAKAMRQAVDAKMQGIVLEKYAETHKELKTALQMWR